jgi:hypothetical protein
MQMAFGFRRRIASVNLQGTMSDSIGQLSQLVFL